MSSLLWTLLPAFALGVFDKDVVPEFGDRGCAQVPKSMGVQDATQRWKIEDLESACGGSEKYKNSCFIEMPRVIGFGRVGESLENRNWEGKQQPQNVMRDAEDEVESHVIGVIESRKHA